MLKDHQKNLEFWLDFAALALLWLGVIFIPEETMSIGNLSLTNLLKIVALIGSLEALGYFSHRLLGQHRGLLLQGFLGGLISSTMTYLRICNLPHGIFQPILIIRTLLLAIVAMLLECLLIIYTIHPSPHEVSRLIMIQGSIILVVILVLSFFKEQKSSQKELQKNEFVINDPIVWKKVVYFSLLIIIILQLLHFADNQLNIPYIYSSLLISLMEAHGVLAAAVTNFSNDSDTFETKKVIAMILIGNVIGKTYFVLRCKTQGVRMSVIFVLYGSVIAAILINRL